MAKISIGCRMILNQYSISGNAGISGTTCNAGISDDTGSAGITSIISITGG